ncbi:MAG: GNAT family N-acetyltransferase [Halieaceae bacterium]|nr:GNAT family N-acetyltransferase [Halieaceae bacterium]
MIKHEREQLEIKIEKLDWNKGRSVLAMIRKRVFVDEQGIPESVELDELDVSAQHFVAIVDKKPVGTARRLADGRVGRMAVLSAYRNAGVGSALINYIIEDAMKAGLPRLYLHAQELAIEFYARHGFEVLGEMFYEASLAHQAMELPLYYWDYSQRIVAASYPTPSDQLVLNLARRSQRTIRIFSDTLDHLLFDDKDLAERLSDLARSTRDSKVQILITNSQLIQQKGHRLLDLSRRLPSSVHLHITKVPEALAGKMMVLADHDGVLYMPNIHDGRVRFEPTDRPLCLRLIEAFDRVWQRSEQDPNLRELGI